MPYTQKRKKSHNPQYKRINKPWCKSRVVDKGCFETFNILPCKQTEKKTCY